MKNLRQSQGRPLLNIMAPSNSPPHTNAAIAETVAGASMTISTKPDRHPKPGGIVD